MRTPPTALLTDYYQLTMAQAYFELGMTATAVFELFVRRLPSSREFLLAAGLEQVLEYLETLRFTAADVEFLAASGKFSGRFLDYLTQLRFTGAVHALAEGTPFFAEEPVLRITAPILEAQLLESRLINIVHFQTLIASKAARCVLAAGGRSLADFGMRRAHEADAALYAARAAYVGGFDSTATVEAGRRFGIPLSGTMAHSFIEAHDREEDAFRNFLHSRPEPTTLLVDTYDTERAIRRVVALAREREAAGEPTRIAAVRIDSGDLAAQSRKARAMLDAGGCAHVRIVLSGGLDEHAVAQLVAGGAAVDAFGVGTALDVSADAPALDIAYKLQQYAGEPRYKRSPGKVTWPGAKQVLRERAASGQYVRDRIVLDGEGGPGQPLLTAVMSEGKRCVELPALERIREHARREIDCLPGAQRALSPAAEPYPVVISEAVRELAHRACVRSEGSEAP